MKRALGMLLLCVVVAVVIGLTMSTQTFAATDYWWDSFGSTTISSYSASGGGSGVWNSTSTLWRVNTSSGKVNAKGVTSNWVDGGNAVFAGTAGTITLGNSVSANGLLFRQSDTIGTNAGGYTITLTGNFWVGADSGVTATINSVIAAGSLIKAASIDTGNKGNTAATALNNAGTIVLTAQNTFTGGVTVNLGTLSLDFSGYATNSSNIINSSNALTLGGGALNMKGAGNANKYSQTFSGTTLTDGTTSYVTVTNVSGGSGGTLALGTISRANSGLIDFTSSDVIITAGNTNAANGAYGGDTSILGYWATANTFNDFATNNGSNITTPTYNTTDFTSANGYNVSASGTNQTVAGGGTTINSLLFKTNATAVTGGQINIASGNILEGNLVSGSAVSIANNLTTTNPQGIYVNQTNTGASMTISGSVTGGSTLTKLGAGNLILTGSSYSGGVQVTAGTLTNNSSNLIELSNAIDCGTLAGSSGYQKTTAGTVTFGIAETVAAFKLGDGGTTPTISGSALTLSSGNFALKSGNVNNALAGASAGLVKDTSGTVTINTAATYGGATSVSGGKLLFSGANLTPTTTDVTISAGGTFAIRNSNTVNSIILDGGTLINDAASGFNLGASKTGVGFDFRSGLVSTANGNLALVGANASLVKSTSGTVTWAAGGTATYGGGCVISNGVIYTSQAANVAGTTGSTITMGDAATASGNYSASLIIGNNSFSPNIVIANQSTNGTYTIGELYPTSGNAGSFNGSITLDQPLTISSNGPTAKNYGVHIAGGITGGTSGSTRTVTLTGPNNYQIDGAITKSGSTDIAVDVRTGTGYAVFNSGSALGTYGGGTTVTNGYLGFSSDVASGATSQFGSGTVTLGTASTGASDTVGFVLANTDATMNRAITIADYAAGSYVIGTATNNAATFAGLITTSQNLVIQQYRTAGQGVLAQLMNINGGITSGNSNTDVVSFSNPNGYQGTIYIAGGLNDANGGHIALNVNAGNVVSMTGTSNYAGATTVSSGTLGAGSTNAWSPNSTFTVSGGWLMLSRQPTSGNPGSKVGYDQAIAGLILTHGTVTDNGALTTGAVAPVLTSSSTYDLRSGTVSAVLAGANSSVGLTKSGSGTVTLNCANTYGGATSVSGGTLVLGVASALPSTTNVSVSSGTLNMLANDLSVAGLKLGADDGSTAGTVQDNGTIGGGKTLASASNYDLRSGSVKVALGGSGIGLNKTTSGTVTVSSQASYTGATNVSGGVLDMDAAFSGSTQYNVSAGSIFIEGTAANRISNTTTANLDVSGTGTFDAGQIQQVFAQAVLEGGRIAGTGGGAVTSTAAWDVRSGTISAVMDGSNGLNKTTSGVVTLTAVNSYTGTTTVSGGTLYLASTGALGADDVDISNSSRFTAAGAVGGTVNVNSGSMLLTSTSSVSGAVNVAGGSSATIDGTVGGLVTVSRGFVVVSSTGIANGGVSVTGGSTATVDGTVNGAVTLSAGSTLNGNGTVAGTLSLISSTLSPGHSPGSLRMNSLSMDAGSTYAVDLGASSYDNAIILTGNADLRGATLSLTELADFNFAAALKAHTKFWIIDSDCGTTPVTGEFAGLNSGDTFSLDNGDCFSIEYNVAGDPLGSGNDVVLTAVGVPEPCTMLLLGTGVLGGVGYIRRRAKR